MADKLDLSLPKTVHILGQRFRVREVPNMQDDDGSELAGDCVGDYYRIQVNADLDVSKKWRTLLHEYVHGSMYMTGLNSELPEHLEEIMIQTTEHVVTQFMRTYGKKFLAAIESDI